MSRRHAIILASIAFASRSIASLKVCGLAGSAAMQRQSMKETPKMPKGRTTNIALLPNLKIGALTVTVTHCGPGGRHKQAIDGFVPAHELPTRPCGPRQMHRRFLTKLLRRKDFLPCAMIGTTDPKALRQSFKGDAVA